MNCPICETANAEDARACSECGKQLLEELEAEPELEPLEGHERTEVGADDMDAAFAMAALDTNAIAPVDDLEPTFVADPRAEVAVEPLALDSILPEPTPGAPIYWTDEVPELDALEVDGMAKTPAPPQSGPCPWCAFPGEGLVCNNCGRRRLRLLKETEAQTVARRGDTLLCPACFCRVINDERCSECMAPLPRSELF